MKSSSRATLTRDKALRVSLLSLAVVSLVLAGLTQVTGRVLDIADADRWKPDGVALILATSNELVVTVPIPWLATKQPAVVEDNSRLVGPDDKPWRFTWRLASFQIDNAETALLLHPSDRPAFVKGQYTLELECVAGDGLHNYDIPFRIRGRITSPLDRFFVHD